MPGQLYYLSPVARQQLIDNAIEKGFVNPTSTLKFKGLSAYIQWLARQEFYDARSLDVKESDAARISVGKFPYWSDEANRIQMRLVLSTETEALLIKVATQFMIINNRRGISSLRKDMPNARVSAVLEAVGIGWLGVRVS